MLYDNLSILIDAIKQRFRHKLEDHVTHEFQEANWKSLWRTIKEDVNQPRQNEKKKVIKRKHGQEVQASLIRLEKTIKTSDDRDEVLKAFEGYKQLTTKKRKT